MCDVKVFLTFTSLSLVLLWQLFYLFCSSIVINTVIVTAGNFERNERGRFGALKSDSIHHFFRNACTKSGSLRFSQFSGCWLILSVYILMGFDFPFVRLLGVRSFCYYHYFSGYSGFLHGLNWPPRYSWNIFKWRYTCISYPPPELISVVINEQHTKIASNVWYM
jgi:hypothetical protein